ncbi:ATP-binding protein [Mangrovicoccus algicola]|uniref:histidine kinase n=1 Tax=Mangrovicoccus algicola TaxID=2771008 RepID=A0A8J6YY09_9RHOB|nr:ATP-binding protein [Mangrovicoccus algicola]MBE3637838.1 HAMP domain-containing protein [Mangrovicoccus algicola]
MAVPSLKPYLPQSLTGRATLILLLPVVILQLVVSVVFIQRHIDDVTAQMSEGVLLELHYLLDEIGDAPTLGEARLVARDLGPKLQIRVTIPAQDELSDGYRWYDLSGWRVISALREGLPEAEVIDLKRSKSSVHMRVPTRYGSVDLRFPRQRISAANPHQLLVLMITTGLLMSAIAYLFLRNQLRPITRLAAAAQAFGKGRHTAYKPSGAREVRAAGLAFLDMRDRIERQIESRTLMLSGISHDLRTPLTRMRLELGLMEESEEVEALTRDVADMERLVNEFLAFARGDALEAPEPVDAAAMLQDFVGRASRGGQPVSLGRCDETGIVQLRPMAVARALDNLVGNAVRYGSHAWVSLEAGRQALILRVEDDGPGIPEAERDQAVKAFARLDPARNQNLPGVGLGLSIAADIARSHGGQLRLGSSASHGGLRADLVLAR